MNFNRLTKILFPVMSGIFIFLIILVGAVQSSINNTAVIDFSSIKRTSFSMANLNFGSSFKFTFNSSLDIPENENGGSNISRFFFITPLMEEHIIELFASMYLDISLNGNQYNFVIIKPGSFRSITKSGWFFEIEDPKSQKSWFSSETWDSIYLSSRSYPLFLTVFGVTTSPKICKYGRFFCDNLTLSFEFGFELS